MSEPTDPASADGAARRPAPRARCGIGSIAGIDVLDHLARGSSSRLLISLGVRARASSRCSPASALWKYVAGLVFAVVLYLSVLLHEASHAVMAQRFGFGVTSITLHFLGGMTEIDGEPAQAPPGVLDRRRRPAHLDRGRRWPRSGLVPVPDGLVRVAIEGLRAAPTC